MKHHHVAEWPGMLSYGWTLCGHAENSAPDDETHRFRTAKHANINVAKAGECQRALPPVESRQRHHHPASCMTGANHPEKNISQGLIIVTLHELPGSLSRAEGERSVTDAVDHTHQGALSPLLDHEGVAVHRHPMTGTGSHAKDQRAGVRGRAVLRQPFRRAGGHTTFRHFFKVILVPLPTSVSISISSIRRLAPGKPRPNPLRL